MSLLSKILARVLLEQEGGKEIVQMEEKFTPLCKLADPANQSLNQFVTYLKGECGLHTNIVFAIVEKLSLDPDFKAVLGKKIVLLWLKHKIYEVLDVKSSEHQKRTIVQHAIDKFNFPGSSLEKLLEACITAIKGSLEDLECMKQILLQGERSQEIENLFASSNDKSIEQTANDYIRDYKQVPQGLLEKNLLRELIITFFRLHPTAKQFKIADQVLELKDQNNNLKALQSAYLKQYSVIPKDVQSIFKKLQSGQQASSIHNHLCALKRKMIIIDVLELERLIEKTKGAGKKIQGKDVIFIIGTTGSGKSTNILKFLGYKLKEDTFKGLPTLVPVQELAKDHKTFNTSPQTISCTRYINAAPIPQDFYQKGTKSYQKTLVICDSPGFGDSAGVQVDIANGVGMINALYESRSVRVVVLLAHDALTPQKSKGALQIGNIISNLFYNIAQVLGSIAIYFNKVPKNQIDVLPNLIKNKIQTLSPIQKADQKLLAFLQHLKEKSQDKHNFIYPLESDYKELFRKLVKIPPIDDVKAMLRYDFADSTKKEINSFIADSKIKIKDGINTQRLQKARFHFQMLKKLKNILSINEKINEAFNEMTNFIKAQAQTQFRKFQQNLIDICKGEENEKIASNLVSSKKKVQSFADYFKQFQQISPTSKQQINKVIQLYKQRLLGECKTLESFNYQKVFTSVKKFSQLLDPKLQNTVVDNINKQFRQEYKKVLQSIEQQNYDMAQDVKRLKSAAGFIHFFSPQHPSQPMMDELKGKFNTEVDRHLQFIAEKIIQETLPLTARTVNMAKDRLIMIQKIDALKIIKEQGCLTKKLNECIKKIILKCKMGIRELDKIDISITSGDNRPVADRDYLRDLASKKTQIQLLMKISNVGDILKQQYEYTKQNIGRRLTENVEILNNCICALRENKTSEIERDLSLIKRAAQMVLKCSQCVEQGENYKQLAESISGQFQRYLNMEMQNFKGIQISLGVINQQNSQNVRKIERQYKKNQTYTKMGSLGTQIQQKVSEIKSQFMNILINPLSQFISKDLDKLNQRTDYPRLGRSLDNFQRLCYYSLQIEQIISSEDRSEFVTCAKPIQSCIQKYLQKIIKQVNLFCSNSQLAKDQQYLKELIKVLVTMSGKRSTCIYLSRKMDFEVTSEIEKIRQHLYDIKCNIESKFSQYNQSVNRMAELTKLVQICRFYYLYERDLKIKEQLQRINFYQFGQKINACLSQNLKDDQDRARCLIKGTLPSKILWQDVKSIYLQFRQMGTGEGNRKKGVVTQELAMLQTSIIQDLKSLNHKIFSDPDIITKDKGIMNDLLEKFQEALTIKEKLESIYLQEDRMLIRTTNILLRGVGTNMIDIFKNQFSAVQKQLTDYNITNIKQNINNFGVLENIINSVFLQVDHGQSQEHILSADHASNFIDTKKKLLRSKISQYKTIEDFQMNDINNDRHVSLKKLFTLLSKCIIQEIWTKYDNYSDDFIIDRGFKKYYTNFLHPREAANTDHKNHLGQNVTYYFSKLFDDYKSFDSQEKRKEADKKITQSIQNLPPDLKQKINQQYSKFKSQIKDEHDQMMKEHSSQIRSSPVQIDNYLAAAVKANKNGQKVVYIRFAEQLSSVFQEKSRSLTTITDKIAFISDYFIKVLERNKEILNENTDLEKRISSRLDDQLKRLSNIIQTQLLKIKKFIENPAKLQQQKNDTLQSVKEVFQAHQFIFDLGKDHSQVRGKLISSIEQKLIQVIKIYNERVANQPQENLSSVQILDGQKTKKLTSFMEYLIKTNQLIEAIKYELERVQNAQNFNKEIVEGYTKVKGQSETIVFYQSQVKNMLQFANNFKFYDQQKKNMTIKQLQKEMLSIKDTVDILRQKMQFFNKYILSKNEAYDFNTISEKFPIRLQNFIMEAKVEIEEAFNNLGGDPVTKINLLVNILRIMKEKKLKLVADDELEKNYNELLRLLKNHFERMRQRCSQKIKAAHNKKLEVQQKINKQQMSKKTEVSTVQKQIQAKIKTETETITKIYDQKIATTNDEKEKQNWQNGKKIEVNSVKNKLTSQKQQRIKRIQEKYNNIIIKLNQSLSQPLNELAQSLALYKKVVLNINYDNQKTVAQFQAVLDQIPKEDTKFVKLIETKLATLPNDQLSFGKTLLTTNVVFSSFVARQMAKLIKGNDIKYVLDNIQNIILKGREAMPKQTKDTIGRLYLQFMTCYEQFKTLYNRNSQESTISFIATECKDLGAMLKLDFYQNDRPKTGNKIRLLSGIFAIWAIQKSQKNEEQIQYTMEPHPTQITTLIVLIGMAHQGEKIANRLAQVGTGEGKSIVLAGLSSYLALCGFKVCCACYSAYLSGRDQSSFRELFEKLGIENDIKYGTFNQLCEDTLNQGGIIFKKEVQKMVIEQPQASWQKIASQIGSNLLQNKRGADKSKQKPSILVIDEVDIFFDERFFGSTYCPGIKLTDPVLANFLEYVWKEVSKLGENVDPLALIASQQFKKLVKRYPNLSKLLENQVHGMVAGALSYKHDYFLIDKKLAYKDNDTISSNISYGYKTVFANIFEHYKGRVSRQNLDEALQICLMVAQLSYAMLPKYFQNILGVTGTLEILPEYKKKLLKERYRIEDQYAIPSAFGNENRRTDKYHIVPSGSFYQTIIAKINQVQDKRPILIFFKQARDLNEFSQYPWYDPYLKRTYNLTQEHEPAVRTSRINGAVNPDTITLVTNSFGRGTDFNLLDNNIKEKGGLHVIHAFLSHDESEEIQIKGRTARQSNRGSYDCIINQNTLQQLGLTITDFSNDTNPENIHKILLKAREDKANNLSQSTLKFLKESDQKHEKVVKIFTQQGLSPRDLIDYVQKLNLYPEMTRQNVKAVLGLDATGSMGGALKKTCEVINTAFQRAYSVLTEEKVRASFEIKIMIYRNYNSPSQEILQTTAFENKPHNLHKFLERVGPKGGWGNEAIQVFFQALNKEDTIDMAILIGDAAPNTAQEVPVKRSDRGENYWNSNGFPATNIAKEIEKFAQKKSPVHSFYLNAGPAFIDISKKTGGTASPFNLSSSKVADELTAFVVQNVVKLIGEKSGKGGEKLVETYRRMFT